VGGITAPAGDALVDAGEGGAGTAAGTTGTASGGGLSAVSTGSAGAGGARGFSITGNSLITFSSWTGVVDGPTTG